MWFNECILLILIFVLYCDEFLEIVGFFIEGLVKKFFYILDIDKWECWDV